MPAASLIDCEATLMEHDVVHRPVLLRESLEGLRLSSGGTVVDATLGPGGHAESLLELVGPAGRVIEILGRPDDFGIDVEILIRAHHIPHQFPGDVLEQARAIPGPIPEDEIAKRVTAAITDVTQLPKEAVWVVFEEVDPPDWYVGGKPDERMAKK